MFGKKGGPKEGCVSVAGSVFSSSDHRQSQFHGYQRGTKPQHAQSTLDLDKKELNVVLSQLHSHWNILESEVLEINKDIRNVEECLKKYGEIFRSTLHYLRDLKETKKDTMKQILHSIENFNQSLQGSRKLVKSLAQTALYSDLQSLSVHETDVPQTLKPTKGNALQEIRESSVKSDRNRGGSGFSKRNVSTSCRDSDTRQVMVPPTPSVSDPTQGTSPSLPQQQQQQQQHHHHHHHHHKQQHQHHHHHHQRCHHHSQIRHHQHHHHSSTGDTNCEEHLNQEKNRMRNENINDMNQDGKCTIASQNPLSHVSAHVSGPMSAHVSGPISGPISGPTPFTGEKISPTVEYRSSCSNLNRETDGRRVIESNGRMVIESNGSVIESNGGGLVVPLSPPRQDKPFKKGITNGAGTVIVKRPVSALASSHAIRFTQKFGQNKREHQQGKLNRTHNYCNCDVVRYE